MPALSAVVITFNEEKNIRRCLQSVRELCDEMLVVDSGSTDATVAICTAMGAKVIHQDFLGYVEQKNFAAEQAKNDWVLSLDADEVLTPELIASIAEIFPQPVAKGYTMNRLTDYCGKWVRHGGWYPDVKLRLFNRKEGAWSGINPHDRYVLKHQARPVHLAGDILHYSYQSISDHLRQIDHFSRIGAKALYDRGEKSNLLKLLYKPPARFLRNYILRRGFLDGMTGLVIGVNSAHAVFLKYLRLYYLQKGKTL